MSNRMDLENTLTAIYNIYDHSKKSIKENKISMIEGIEQCDNKEIRFAYLDAIEDGLLERKEYIREKVFFQEYDRALKLYHDICEENGLTPKKELARRIYS